MLLDELSFCFTTNKITECKDFYIKYFSATVTFDAEWYVVLFFRAEGKVIAISLMKPQESEVLYKGGVTLNMKVADVDKEYMQFSQTDIKISTPIADQPWGDRSFRIIDPLGSILYIYSDREPSEEYKKAYK